MQLLSMTRTLARSLLAPRYRSAWSRTPGGVAQPCAVEETGGRENSPSFLTTGAPDSWQHPKKIATVEPAELRTVHRERCVCPNDGQVPVVGPQDPRCTANGRRGGTGFWSHSDDGSLRLCCRLWTVAGGADYQHGDDRKDRHRPDPAWPSLSETRGGHFASCLELPFAAPFSWTDGSRRRELPQPFIRRDEVCTVTTRRW